jgi:hypothetical protein
VSLILLCAENRDPFCPVQALSNFSFQESPAGTPIAVLESRPRSPDPVTSPVLPFTPDFLCQGSYERSLPQDVSKGSGVDSQRNLELVWLTGRLMPDFKTTADLRKNNGTAVREVRREFVVLF